MLIWPWTASGRAGRGAGHSAGPGARHKAVAKAQARETAVARQNVQIAALNAAICQLLSETTGENLPQSPEDWSEWWADTDEVYVPGYKPLETTYVPDRRSISDQRCPCRRKWQRPIHYSCLAAGTPIWTDAGPVAVEKIKVGDRVLAQHPETGELAYKPVLHTTVRLKAELVKLELVDDTVTCSVGHGFWIAGKGWVKARDIQPNMHFHGADGHDAFAAVRAGRGGAGVQPDRRRLPQLLCRQGVDLQPRHHGPQAHAICSCRDCRGGE